jgi:hypothetical protein
VATTQSKLTEYASLVAYFSSAPPRASAIVDHLSTLGQSLFGTAKVWYDPGITLEDVRAPGRNATKWIRSTLCTTGLPVTGERDGTVCVECYCYPKGQCKTNPRVLAETLCTFELDWRPVASGQPLGPTVRLDINLCRLETTPDALRDTVLRFFRFLVDTGLLSYGFCDIASVAETDMGRYYSGTTTHSVTMPRHFLRTLWIKAGAQRWHMAQWVFWANVFGPTMAQRLGGAGQLIRDYRANEDGLDHDLGHVVNGDCALAYLCRDAKVFRYPHGAPLEGTMNRATWLWSRLREAGLLIPCCSP